MQIAYLLGSLNRGGTETLLLDCFRNAMDAPFPFVGIYRKEGALSDEFRKTGLPLFCLAPQSKIDILYLVCLRRLLIRQSITIVHAQQPIDAIYARLATIGTTIKVVSTFHGYDLAAGKWTKKMVRWIIRRTDLNIFVSNAQKEYYQQQYTFSKVKSATVYNGIAFDKLTQLCCTNALRKEFEINAETLLLGSVGNFGAVRDQFTICQFLKRLKVQGVDFRFLFVGKKNKGEESLYDQCVGFCNENGLTDSVLFLGSRSDVPAILSQLDAFVYSTDHDTFGIAVIEAMATGLPVFVNDWNVMREISEDGKYAHLYQTKEPANLLEIFLPFIADKATYKKDAQTAARWVKEKFSIQQHLRRLSEEYKKL
jgi:glycosyltransferase involved in cell wall biosynthesis